MQSPAGKRLAQSASTLLRPRPPGLWSSMPRVVQYMSWELYILR
jgi:hypothetical protein